MAVTDTPPQVRRRVSAVFASMSGAERVACAAEMAEESKLISLAGIRSRLPELTDAELALEWLRLLHGDDVADFAARCSSNFLSFVVDSLDEAGIPHMLAGSMASTFHGEPRMTRDIDLVIDPTLDAVERFAGDLDRSRYYIDDALGAVCTRDRCDVIDTETGWKADLIIRKERPFSREEFRRRQRAIIGDVDLFVATAEDTVLAKLEWRSQSGSDEQFRDVVAILAAQDLDIGYLRRWAFELGVTEALDEALSAAGR